MTRISIGAHVVAIIVATALGIACRNALSPADVAGTYDLSATTGTIGRLETPVSGFLTLTADGGAQRRVSYYRDSSSAVTEVVALGTYRVADSIVYLSLREDSGQSPYLWHVAATVEQNRALRLTYPRPADGTIVEIYQLSVCSVCRQTP